MDPNKPKSSRSWRSKLFATTHDGSEKFIGKKKADTKFKQAGPGHKLTENAPGGASGSSSGGQATRRTPTKEPRLSQEQTSAAAAAALARLEKTKSGSGNSNQFLQSRQAQFIKEQARKQIEAEKRAAANPEQNKPAASSSSDTNDEYTMFASCGGAVDPDSYAVAGVYYTCPLIGPEIGPKTEIEEKIYKFLLDQPPEDLGVTSCLLIHSCNKGRDRIQACVDTLCKYLDNIIKDPNEVKFQRIRCNNKIYQEKVRNVIGAEEFLQAAGFIKQLAKATDTSDTEEEFWIYSPDGRNADDAALLVELRDTLKETSPIKAELDRNLQVLMPTQVTKRRELPPEFYELSGEELKREQKRRTEIAERELTLRTKAQREQDERREQRVYRYAVIRIRFPDGITLQGTFHATEKVQDIYTFVQENLGINGIEFSLRKPGGQILSDQNATLSECHLPPSSILNFKVEKMDNPQGLTEMSYLNGEILALVRSMDEM